VGDLVMLPTAARHNSVDAKRARKALYLEWMVLPRDQRDPATKTELAAQLGCTLQTLMSYERDPDFSNEVSRRLSQAFRIDRLSQVFEALYTTAVGGGPQSVAASRTLLEWFDRGQQARQSDLSELSEEQIRQALAQGA
jgi:hypothetical protein